MSWRCISLIDHIPSVQVLCRLAPNLTRCDWSHVFQAGNTMA